MPFSKFLFQIYKDKLSEARETYKYVLDSWLTINDMTPRYSLNVNLLKFYKKHLKAVEKKREEEKNKWRPKLRPEKHWFWNSTSRIWHFCVHLTQCAIDSFIHKAEFLQLPTSFDISLIYTHIFTFFDAYTKVIAKFSSKDLNMHVFYHFDFLTFACLLILLPLIEMYLQTGEKLSSTCSFRITFCEL